MRLASAGISEIMDLCAHHDQVFVLKDGEIMKLHTTKDVQKLVLD